jgi:hypothetical protein
MTIIMSTDPTAYQNIAQITGAAVAVVNAASDDDVFGGLVPNSTSYPAGFNHERGPRQ